MFTVDNLKSLKASNEALIAENLEIIRNKNKINADLEAENRVFDKLIDLCEPAPITEHTEIEE